MLSNLPVAHSRGARVVFLGSALLTAAIALWANNGMPAATADLAPVFVYLFTILDYAGANCALLILVAAVFVTQRHSVRPLLLWIADHVSLLAGATFIALCLGSLLIYRDYPLSMDEYCAYFQSQIFAARHLAGQFPPALLDWVVPHQFQNAFLFASPVTGKIASAYWPSFALLLTPFTLSGIPWACNPAISALTLLAIHRLALRIFADREAAGLAILLTVASPVFCADGISYYSMSAHLLANAVFALLLLEPTPRRAALAGLVGSIALTLHNPVPHMLFAAPWILWLLGRRGGVAMTAWLIAGYLPLSILLGFGWFLFSTGVPHDGVAVTAGSAIANRFVARTSSALGSPTLPLLVARLIGLAKVVVWAVPGILLLAVAGGWKWRHNIHCRLLALSAFATLLGFLYIPVDQGHGWGFRYFHSAWLALPLLAAGAMTPRANTPNDLARPRVAGAAFIFEDAGTRTFVVACALFTLVCGNGFHAYQIREFVTMNLEQVPQPTGTGRQVVMIDPRFSFYPLDLVRNDPWLRDETIHMISHGELEDAAQIRKYYPDLHRVHEDRYGSIWSTGPAQESTRTPRSVPRQPSARPPK